MVNILDEGHLRWRKEILMPFLGSLHQNQGHIW